MNLLVVGVSHRTANVPLLESLSVPVGAAPATLGRVVAQGYVDEAVVLSTCNRVEIYAAVSAFHTTNPIATTTSRAPQRQPSRSPKRDAATSR